MKRERRGQIADRLLQIRELREVAAAMSQAKVAEFITRVVISTGQEKYSLRLRQAVDSLQLRVGPLPKARVGELAARLMTRVEKEYHLYRLPHLIRGLRGFGSRVSEGKANQVAERLVGIMEKHEKVLWLAYMV